MKSRSILITGLVSTVLSATQIVGFAEHLDGTQTFSGRVVPLHEYFNMGAGAGHASLQNPYRGNTGGASAPAENRADPNRAQASPGAAPSSQPGVNPGAPPHRATSGETFTGTRDSSLNSTKGGLKESWTGQPLVFIAGSAVQKSPGSSNPSTPSGRAAETEAEREARVSGVGSGAQITAGQAYILICDHKDPTTMAAIAAIQDNRSYVSARDESGKTERPDQGNTAGRTENALRDSDPGLSGTRSTLEGASDGRSAAAPWKSSYGEVKVTGKVMQRGGIQAIQVVSIEAASSSGSKDTVPSASETPRTQPVSPEK